MTHRLTKKLGKVQLFKLPYCLKAKEPNAPLMARCEMKGDVLTNIDTDNLTTVFPSERFGDYCVTNIIGEKLVEFEKKEEKKEDLRRYVGVLDSICAGPHDARIEVIWALACLWNPNFRSCY